MMSLLMLVLILGSAAQEAEPTVKPLGAYPFALPGLAASPDAKPKLLLWCRGVRLVGVVVPGEGRGKSGVETQNAPAPSAVLLRDGRCEADGSKVSFGLLVPLKAWVFESAARTPREERSTWLLHHFEGSVQAGVLKGVSLQVDVNHPGYPFRESKIEVAAMPETQDSFADEPAWVASVARTFTLVRSEP